MTAPNQLVAAKPDQLVVANAHVEIVRKKLGIGVKREERSDELGLTLIELEMNDVAKRAKEILRESPEIKAHTLRSTGLKPENVTFELSVVLKHTYDAVKADHGGWQPIMGKNRTVTGPAETLAWHNINGGAGPHMPEIVKNGLNLRESDPGSGVRIGLADTPLYRHPWLDGAYTVAPAQQWKKSTGHEWLASGHGTFVAGTILQTAPGATIIFEQVLGDAGNGDSWNVAKRLMRLGRAGVELVNLSIGFQTYDNEPPLVLATAINRLGGSIQVVAAAGNHDPEKPGDNRIPTWPAAFDSVLAVSAVTTGGAVPDWSTPLDLPWVDCVALGVDVVSTYPPVSVIDAPDDAFVTWSGTSFAAGSVTGLIAAEIGRTGADPRTATARLLDGATRIGGIPRLI